ncbi:MAG: peptidase domain-containing ABC transporter [Burkholderiaceae bacterium]|nr:peptidase domain-containing ABC transporter [Burkholderiaceae bacterium]
MAWLEQLSFGFGRRLPLMLQTEASECGIACLGMIAGFHGHHTDLASLRRQFSVSIKGTQLNELLHMASALSLGTRPVKLDLEDLPDLRMPCILHWNFNHFVVLKSVQGQTVTIYDPAMGERRLSLSEVSDSFTGVAVEFWPDAGFKKVAPPPRIKLRTLMGEVQGLYRSFGQILLLAGALEVFALVSPFFMQWVIDNVILTGDRNLLTTLAVGFGMLMLMQQGVSTLRSWVIMHMATTLNVQWRANVFTHLLKLPVDYFEKRHLGDVVSRFGAVDSIQRTLTTSFLEAILDGLMAVMTLVMMFVYSPRLAWIAVAAMAVYGLGRWIWYRPLRMATEEQLVHAAKQQSHFLETVRGVKTIKLFQRHGERRSAWLTLLVEQVNADLRTQKLHVLYGLINGLMFGLERILIIWLGATLVMDGNFSVGVLMAFMAYKEQFNGRVSGLIDKFVEMRMLEVQGARLADLVLHETEPDTNTVAHNTATLEPVIEVKDLRFRYADGEPWVLDGVNLRIEAGESVAIVGPSGCGKTTLVNALLGIRQPNAGQILIGGIDIQRLGLGPLRGMVGTVLQDDVLFAGSIADNISFFDPQVDYTWVQTCARMAAIDTDIEHMPMGYNTFIGDMGSALSGGQKQRVLLARALYKRPQILLLDEATSHLDVAREAMVNHSIHDLKVTRVIVAHRPETIASADRVVVMAGGKVLTAQEALAHA